MPVIYKSIRLRRCRSAGQNIFICMLAKGARYLLPMPWLGFFDVISDTNLSANLRDKK